MVKKSKKSKPKQSKRVETDTEGNTLVNGVVLSDDEATEIYSNKLQRDVYHILVGNNQEEFVGWLKTHGSIGVEAYEAVRTNMKTKSDKQKRREAISKQRMERAGSSEEDMEADVSASKPTCGGAASSASGTVAKSPSGEESTAKRTCPGSTTLEQAATQKVQVAVKADTRQPNVGATVANPTNVPTQPTALAAPPAITPATNLKRKRPAQQTKEEKEAEKENNYYDQTKAQIERAREAARLAARCVTPIVVHGNYLQKSLYDKLKAANIKFTAEPKKTTTVILPATNEDYDETMKIIKQSGTEGYTYSHQPQTTVTRIVKRISSDWTADEVKNEIQRASGITAAVSPMTSQGDLTTTSGRATRTPVSMFRVTADNKDDMEKIQSVGLFHVPARAMQWEGVRRSDVLQCYNCQRIGHAAANCLYEHRCVKCKERHARGECSHPRNLPAYCINCDTIGHPANYRQCSYYQHAINLKQHRIDGKTAIETAKQKVRDGFSMMPNPTLAYARHVEASRTTTAAPPPRRTTTAPAAAAPWKERTFFDATFCGIPVVDLIDELDPYLEQLETYPTEDEKGQIMLTFFLNVKLKCRQRERALNN